MQSTPGEGTTVKCILPVRESAEEDVYKRQVSHLCRSAMSQNEANIDCLSAGQDLEGLTPIENRDAFAPVSYTHLIYLGSFSKILAPALRARFVVARNAPASQLAVAKQTTDVHSNSLAQIICNEFLTRWDVNEHIAGLQATYRKKAQTMC